MSGGYGSPEYFSRQYSRARTRAERAEQLLDVIATAHAPNAVTKCCEQCGRPSPCLTLQLLEKK